MAFVVSCLVHKTLRAIVGDPRRLCMRTEALLPSKVLHASIGKLMCHEGARVEMKSPCSCIRTFHKCSVVEYMINCHELVVMLTRLVKSQCTFQIIHTAKQRQLYQKSQNYVSHTSRYQNNTLDLALRPFPSSSNLLLPRQTHNPLNCLL